MHKIWIKHRENCFKKRHELYKNQGQKRVMDGPSPNRKRLFELLRILIEAEIASCIIVANILDHPCE